MFNSRSAAFFIALSFSVLAALALWALAGVTGLRLAASFLTCLALTTFLVYVLFEVLLLQEIKTIYADLEKIKRNEFTAKARAAWFSPKQLTRVKDEFYLLEVKKQQELDEMKRLDAFRREFLADVSHELKTPVFAAQGFVHTLIDGAVDDPAVRDKFLEKAARSLDRLDVLVQDLISISQMEKGMLKMQRLNFNIVKMTQEVFEQLELKARERSIALHLHDTGLLRLEVYADPARIRQVMTNLIDNAIKYGRGGGNIWVSFQPGAKKVLINVRDDGEGIAKEHQTRIFERFYRVDKSRSRARGGSGLGLAISKHIVESHNSRLLVISTLGKGTTMRFKLPKAKPAPADLLPPHATATALSG